jgi:hypothetical protein
MKFDMYVYSPGTDEGYCSANDSEPTTLGGRQAWTKSKLTETDPTVIVRVVGAVRADFRYCIFAYFGDPPDPTIFDRIIESFRFLQ